MKKIIVWTLAAVLLGPALLGAGTALAADGKALYTGKCASCHGVKGDGKGPVGASLSPGPGNFTDAKFWQGDVEKKVREAVTNGKGAMPAQVLQPDEIKALVDYITSAFKK
jgi:cytochrome c oxidase cbb3-type subunit II